MRVEVTVELATLDSPRGEVPGICVTCSRCDHSVEVFGESEASIKRGCATLRDECPENETNFYVHEG